MELPPDSHTAPPAFDISDYTHERLIELLADHRESSKEVIKKKSHIVLLKDYFEKLQAKSVIRERDYIDRDFLEDYSSYYVRCFHRYDATCVRLHFFSEHISSESFTRFLQGTAPEGFVELLQGSYLGFIVVKPLPQTIIGRTCLKTYDEEDGRFYPITRPYEATLYGLPLKVSNTLAFQEQDSVAAACATSALWSTFQGTGKQFQHKIPSPVEITKAAHSRFPMEERELPTHGLFIWQMAHAIASVGLEPLAVKIKDDESNRFCLQSTAYAYLRGGIPVPLVVDVHEASDRSSKGEHAVAITGYSIGNGDAKPYGDNGFILKASRIDKLYVHDDGIGPFARMKLEDYVEYSNDDVIYETLRSEELRMTRADKDGNVISFFARPEYLLIPVYHKIRIPFRTALNVIMGFDEFIRLDKVAYSLNLEDPLKLEWDIYLTEASQFKRQIALASQPSGAYRQELLLEPMPKYIWRATAEHNGEKALDILLDATDIEQGPIAVSVVEYEPNIGHALRNLTKQLEDGEDPHELYPVRRLLQLFAEQPVEEQLPEKE